MSVKEGIQKSHFKALARSRELSRKAQRKPELSGRPKATLGVAVAPTKTTSHPIVVQTNTAANPVQPLHVQQRLSPSIGKPAPMKPVPVVPIRPAPVVFRPPMNRNPQAAQRMARKQAKKQQKRMK